MKLWGIILTLALFISAAAAAQVGDSPHEISVFATICEPLINGESKSSARVRASDKASFKAVEEIPELSRYRDRLDTHHFNLNVYRLVDNYLEDIKINTTSQENNRVCVEVSAYLPSSAIAQVFLSSDADEAEAIPEADDDLMLELETEDLANEISIAVPPKPEIIINKQIAYNEDQPSYSEQTDATALVTAEPQSAQPQLAEPQPAAPQHQPQPAVRSQPAYRSQPAIRSQQQKAEDHDKTLIFVDQTEFYNGTTTAGFFAHLEQSLLVRPGVKVIAGLNNPDYILKTKVLKAKVDNVNSETSRLQIVVALELTDTTTSETITDHQNRFILFNSNEDAQKTAADLTKKLFSAGIAKLLPKIKTKEAVIGNSIITPH